MQRTGADIILESLRKHGIRIVAGMPGGANLPLYDALTRSDIQHVLVRHEQAAGFIAQGMARVSGRAAVCFATSGPGATNLITALADAFLDSIPIIAITGQVPTALLGTSAFQEVDTVAMAKPIVKHAELVRDVAELEAAMERAFEISQSGRPGPVLIDVPKDVQQAAAPAPVQLSAPPSPRLETQPLDPSAIDTFLKLLAASERPVLYVGGGISHSGAQSELARLAIRQDIPVACTLMGLGCFDPNDSRYLGMLGMHAAPYTNLIMREADLLICIGARFDDRATGKPSDFCPNARTVHVDVDPRELGKLRALDLGIAADAKRFLEALGADLPARTRTAWRERVETLRTAHPLPVAASAARVLDAVAAARQPGTIVCTDVGQHQMWVAQRMPFDAPRQLLTSGGLGTMGFGLPAAIGAALESQRPALCITGDGSILLNLQELATLAELELDVTILVLDNRHLGLVRQQQTLFYDARLSASRFDRALDFVAIARSFGIEAVRLEPTESGLASLDALLAERGPRLIHVPIDACEMVLPMVPPGAGNHQMLGC
ncbi:MAG TPA: biosynthetic-type acetolactate synthase large subunit [Polyangiales bacterium]|nr:biosynthetic-type acetolactate synthase large subunit [Polyangiales bacterium]